MKFGKLPGIDKPVSRLVQGTVMVSSDRQEEASRLLDGVREHGCTTFDSAHGYGGGKSEKGLGAWVGARGVREEVVILTKGGHPYDGRNRVTPEDITSDLNDSLERLQTDYIDLYLLHRDDPAVPVGPIVDVLNEHADAGRIGAFGGSNWTAERIRDANAYAKVNGLTPFVVSSPNFSLAQQRQAPWDGCLSISGDAKSLAFYEETQLALLPWSSLAGGFFSERFRRDNLDRFDDYMDKLCVGCYCFEENFKRLDRCRELATEKGLSVPQIATAWMMSQPLNVFALVGCANGDEFKANAEALDVTLTPEELAWLNLERDSR